MRRLFACTLFAISSLCADNITLINDSMFPLSVDIYNALGAKEVTVSLAIGQTYIWNRNLSAWNRQYNSSVSPYVVRWFCTTTQPYDYTQTPRHEKQKAAEEQKKYHSEYGTWTNVPSGATVNALRSPNGSKTCTLRREEKKPHPENKPPTPRPPGGLYDWKNDGGETWNNNAGPGWETQLQPAPEEEQPPHLRGMSGGRVNYPP